MFPTHYALTEILIVIAAYFSIRNLLDNKYYYAAIGIFMIGLAALAGAIRFGFLDTSFMIKINGILALFGGIITSSLISTQIIYNSISKNTAKIFLTLSVVAILSLFIWTQPELKIFLLILCSFISILLTFQIAQTSNKIKFLKSFIMAIFLISLLTLHKKIGMFANPEYIPDLYRFHIYHILIAIWVFLINYAINQKNIHQ